MVCVRLPAVKFKRRVQVTVWAGAFVCFAAFEVAGRLLGVLGSVAAPAFENSNGLGNPTLKVSKVSAAGAKGWCKGLVQRAGAKGWCKRLVQKAGASPCDHAQWTPPEEAAARNGTVLASLLLRRSLSSQVAF